MIAVWDWLVDGLVAWVTVFAGALLFITALAYQRTGNRKLLFVSGAFAFFFVKGLLLTLSLFVAALPIRADLPGLGLDALILLLLYYSVMSR